MGVLLVNVLGKITLILGLHVETLVGQRRNIVEQSRNIAPDVDSVSEPRDLDQIKWEKEQVEAYKQDRLLLEALDKAIGNKIPYNEEPYDIDDDIEDLKDKQMLEKGEIDVVEYNRRMVARHGPAKEHDSEIDDLIDWEEFEQGHIDKAEYTKRISDRQMRRDELKKQKDQCAKEECLNVKYDEWVAEHGYIDKAVFKQRFEEGEKEQEKEKDQLLKVLESWKKGHVNDDELRRLIEVDGGRSDTSEEYPYIQYGICGSLVLIAGILIGSFVRS